jgi:non-ribosomal peptide synthetase component F
LENTEPCYFPRQRIENSGARELRTVNVDFSLESGVLRNYCEQNGVTVANVFQAAWGIVLNHYTRADRVCYGYLASGRDIAVDRIEEAVGPFINMLVCCVDVGRDQEVRALVQKVQSDYASALSHQHCSLADIQHEMGLSGAPLFNTMMTIKSAGESQGQPQVQVEDTPKLSFVNIDSHDPTEVCLTLLWFWNGT